MSLRLGAKSKPELPGHGSPATVGGIRPRQALSLAKLRKYAKEFEKKMAGATLKGSNRRPEKRKKLAITDDLIAIPDAVLCPPTSKPAAGRSDKSTGEAMKPGNLTQGIFPSKFTGQPLNNDLFPGLNSIVVKFGSLANLEAQIEKCGHFISVSWIAGTATSYQFMKERIGGLRKYIRQRLNNRITISAHYKKRNPDHR